MTKDKPLPYLVRLDAKERKVLDTYVRQQKRAGRRNCTNADGVRVGIQLLAAQMYNELNNK